MQVTPLGKGGAEPLRLRTRDFSVSPARKKDSHTLLYTRARHGTTQAHNNKCTRSIHPSDSLRTARHVQAQRESRVTTQHLRSSLCQTTCVALASSLFLLACRSVLATHGVPQSFSSVPDGRKSCLRGKSVRVTCRLLPTPLPGVRPHHCGRACHCSRVFLRLSLRLCRDGYFSAWENPCLPVSGVTLGCSTVPTGWLFSVLAILCVLVSCGKPSLVRHGSRTLVLATSLRFEYRGLTARVIIVTGHCSRQWTSELTVAFVGDTRHFDTEFSFSWMVARLCADTARIAPLLSMVTLLVCYVSSCAGVFVARNISLLAANAPVG